MLQGRIRKTMQNLRVQSNIVARSRNHCYSVNAPMHSVCVVESHVTVSRIKIMSVAQQYFYCKLTSQATMQIIRTSFETNYIPTNVHSFHTSHKSSAFKQNNAILGNIILLCLFNQCWSLIPILIQHCI